MRCRAAHRLLGLLDADAGLSAAQQRTLAAHVESCDRCRRAREALRREAGLLEQALEVTSDPGEAVRARILAQTVAAVTDGDLGANTSETRLPGSPVARLRRPVLALAAAAAILLPVALCLHLLRPPDADLPGPTDRRVVVPDEAPQPPGTTTAQPDRPRVVVQAPLPDIPPASSPGPSPQPERTPSTWPPHQPKNVPPTGGQLEPSGPPMPTAPQPYGLIASASGDATLSREGRGTDQPVAEDQPLLAGEATVGRDGADRPGHQGTALRSGDSLRTGDDASLVATFNDGSRLELAAGTELSLGRPSPSGGRPATATLASGGIMAHVEPGGGPFEVDTPVASASVLGTQFSLQATKRKTVLVVLTGAVAFWNSLGRVVAGGMERSVAVRGYAPTAPSRAVGQSRAGWVEKPHLHDGGGLCADAGAYAAGDLKRVYDRLRGSEETPGLLADVLGPLWWGGGGVWLSQKCARELAERPDGLADLRRSDLGLVHPLTKDEDVRGVAIFEVLEGSPGEAAGLREDDMIVSVGGVSVDTEVQLRDELWRAASGSELEVTFLRDGQPQSGTVTTRSAAPTHQELAVIAAFRLLQERPRHAEARLVLANAQACLGGERQAGKAYEAVLADEPGNPVAISNLGFLHELEGEYAEALHAYQLATRLAPGFEGGWVNMAKMYGRAGLPQTELALLQTLVREHPRWELASEQLAFAYYCLGGAASISKLPEIEGLAERHPLNATIACCVARLLARAERPEEAMAACRRALTLGPADPPARRTMASYLLPPEEGDKAIAEMLKLWAPERYPLIYAKAGNYYGGRGLGSEGRAAINKGLKLDPANSVGYTGYMWVFLGQVEGGLGRTDEALSSFRKAAELETQWALPWLRRGGTLMGARRPAAEVKASYHKALDVGLTFASGNADNISSALNAAIALTRLSRALDEDDEARRYGRIAARVATQAEALDHPDLHELFTSLVGYYIETDDLAGLERVLDRTIRSGRGDVPGLAGLAGQARAAGQTEAAISIHIAVLQCDLSGKHASILVRSAFALRELTGPSTAEDVVARLRAASSRGHSDALRLALAGFLIPGGGIS